MLNDAKNLGSSLAFCEAAKCIGQRKSSLKMCTSLHRERVRRLQTATLRQPVHNTALYVKTEFSMRTEQGKQFLSLLIQQICTEHLHTVPVATSEQ